MTFFKSMFKKNHVWYFKRRFPFFDTTEYLKFKEFDPIDMSYKYKENFIIICVALFFFVLIIAVLCLKAWGLM